MRKKRHYLILVAIIAIFQLINTLKGVNVSAVQSVALTNSDSSINNSNETTNETTINNQESSTTIKQQLVTQNNIVTLNKQCEGDLKGKSCELKPCDPVKDGYAFNECFNGGKCYKNTDTNQYQCECVGKYTGPNCKSTLCDGYCINNGRCRFRNETPASNPNHNDISSFVPTCDCINERFSGRQCQFDKCKSSLKSCNSSCFLASDCECKCGSKCDEAFCNSKGKCIENRDQESDESVLVCKCNPGYSGSTCQIDDCIGYCFNNGDCIRESDGLRCHCKNGSKEKRCAVNNLGENVVIATHANKTNEKTYRSRFRLATYFFGSIALICIVSLVAFVLYKGGHFDTLIGRIASSASSTNTSSGATSNVSFRIPSSFRVFRQTHSFAKLGDEQPITNDNL